MSAKDRERIILGLLKNNNMVTIPELEETLKTSRSTIHRDLIQLSKAGKLQRIHGGAIALNEAEAEPFYDQRMREMLSEKEAIAQLAASMVHDGDIIAMDSGTTIAAMMKYLKNKTNVTIITCSVNLAYESNQLPSQINVILAGGFYRPNTLSLVGDIAEETISKFRANKAFMGCSAFSIERGTMNSNDFAIGSKKALVNISDEIIVLADHSKIQKYGVLQTIPIDRIDTLITDSGVSSDHVHGLEGKGVKVMIAKS